MKDKALKLASQGFRVFPIKSGTKGQPLIKDYLNKATADKAQVEAWWTKWPQSNIGIVPGPNHLVIDIDAYKSEAQASAKKLNPPATMTVKTPGGGFHLYYKHPGGGVIGNDNKEWSKMFSGIEVRADKGYVLGPGSVVGGREYTIVKGAAGRKSLSLSRTSAGLMALPLTIIKLLPYKERTWMTAPKTLTDLSAQPSSNTLPDVIKAGERDNTMFRYICGLVAQGLSKQKIVRKAGEAFKRCEQPQADIFPWATIEGMIDRALNEYAPAPPDKNVYKRALERYVLIEKTDEVADLLAHPRAAVLKKTSWAAARSNVIIGKNDKGKPTRLPQIWLNDPQRLSVHTAIYRPAKSRIITKNGHDYYNNYFPSDLKPAIPYNESKCKVILDHLLYMFRDSEVVLKQFLKWLAFTVRIPHLRIPWAPLLISSTQGIGKGRVYLLLEKLMGPENCRQIFPSDLTEARMQFNEWMGYCLLWIDELDPKWDFYDKLKPIITEPRCIINKKYGAKEHVEVFCNVIMATNHGAALKTPKQDRRIWAIDADADLRPPDYYEEVHNWIERTDGPAHFLGMLHDINLEGFKFAAPPPITTAKKVMIADSRSEIEVCIHDAIDLKNGPFAFDIVDTAIVRPYVETELKLDRVSFAEKQLIGRTLEAICKHEPMQFTITTLNKKKARRRLKIIRNPAKWRKATKEAIIEEYMKALEGGLK